MDRPTRALVLGCLLFLLIAPARVEAPEAYVLVRGKLISQPHELAEGYFNFGEVTTLHVKPDTPAWLILRDLNGRAVELVIRLQEPRKLQRIDRD